jgi:hypothetical protein
LGYFSLSSRYFSALSLLKLVIPLSEAYSSRPVRISRYAENRPSGICPLSLKLAVSLAVCSITVPVETPYKQRE